MTSITLSMTSAAIALAVTWAGCTHPPTSGEEGFSGEDFVRSCLINLLAVSEIPEDAYVLDLDPQAWQENAPLMDARLRDFEANDSSLPYSIGGNCKGGYEAEVEWMISRYEEDPEARTTETRPNVHKFFFTLHRGEIEYGMSALADYYGYDRYPE